MGDAGGVMALNCRICGVRSFATDRGLRQHERHCANRLNGKHLFVK